MQLLDLADIATALLDDQDAEVSLFFKRCYHDNEVGKCSVRMILYYYIFTLLYYDMIKESTHVEDGFSQWREKCVTSNISDSAKSNQNCNIVFAIFINNICNDILIFITYTYLHAGRLCT